LSKLDSLAKWGGVAAIALYLSDAQLPSIPDWAPLAVGGLFAGAVAANWAAGKVLDLLPDDNWDVYLYEVRSDDEDYMEKWGMTRDYWEECVCHGNMNQLKEKGDGHYECYRFDPSPSWWDDDEDGGFIQANWRGQDPDSAIVGQYDGSDARKEIKRIKNELEDDAAAGRVLIERYPSILRRLDRDRAVRFVKMLGGDVSGDIGDRDVDDVIRDALPDELVPAVLVPDGDLAKEDDEDEVVGPDEFTTGQAVAKLIDGDLSAPSPGVESSSTAVATDGGETDE